MVDPSVHPQYRAAIVTDDKMSGTPGFNYSSTGRTNRFREELQEFSKEDQEVGSITSNVGTSKPRPYRPSINAKKYFAKRIKKSADVSNSSRIDGFREELQEFSKEDQEVGSITSSFCTSKPRPYRPSINADKYFGKRIKKSSDDSNISCIDGFREKLQEFSKEDQEVGSITSNVCTNKLRAYRPSINADKYFAKRMKKSADDSNISCIDREELQEFNKEHQEVGSITSNVGTSKPRPYRPSINADKYFAKGIKKSADDSNKSSIDGNPELGKPTGSQLHKRRPTINIVQGNLPTTDRDVPINSSTSFNPIDESVFDDLQLPPVLSQSPEPRFSSQQSSSTAKDKPSPKAVRYSLSTSSDCDGKISPDLENSSTGGLNPNTNYFGDSPEDEEKDDGKQTGKSIWSEMEISDSSGEETAQIEGAQLSIEEQHRQMLGNKLTAKFSATLPAENSAHLDDQSQYLKMPHFIAVESKAYVAKDFKNAMTSEDLKDEQAREDFKNRLKTTVRWREDENKIKESNSRIVRWSDGSETFHVGGEVFDVMHHPVTNDQNHMYVRLESFYQPQVPIKDKMTLRPKLDSEFGQTHVQGMRNRAVNKPQTGVKVLMNTDVDPAQDHERRVKQELAQLRLEEREKRRETQMNRRKPPARPMRHCTADDTDPDSDMDINQNQSDVEGSNDEDNYSKVNLAAASDDDLSDEPRCSTSKGKKILPSDSDEAFQSPSAGRKAKPMVYTDSDSSY
ncbi:RNA polymerase-associated protein LEO1 isoform X3 [Drosophila suzukii]|uniref:RNA polymerase-associated protein LEO1 isoform X3 n=1 Tax=Drosophila suzukii TaxID=28584 RepID=A0ABM4TPD0_DROSZ